MLVLSPSHSFSVMVVSGSAPSIPITKRSPPKNHRRIYIAPCFCIPLNLPGDIATLVFRRFPLSFHSIPLQSIIDPWAFSQPRSADEEIFSCLDFPNYDDRGVVDRVVFASTIVCVAIVLALKFALPNLVLQNLWPMLFALRGILLAVVAQTAILTLIPPFVTIRNDRVQYVHGQNGFEIKTKSIAWIQVTVFSKSVKRI